MQRRKRIALVNQRYGLEVNGGSEYYTRILAEHLKDRYDIEILTTKALDHAAWANYYTKDVETINGVSVKRFDVEGERNPHDMERFYTLSHEASHGRRLFEYMWIGACGPRCPKLVKYIKKHKDDYDAIVFVTYLYYPAVFGIRAAPEKAILLPTAHDEPYIYMGAFRNVFETPRALIYLTHEEKAFVESLFNVADKPHCIAGAGIDLPDTCDNDSFRKKYALESDYLIYTGRIEIGKNSDRMIEMFQTYKRMHPESDVKLVLMGKSALDLPDDENIIVTGFVSDQEKYDGISGACALWLPSKFESLSIAVLEALSLGVPVLVNGECAVLEGHCKRSHAGWSYKSEDEAIDLIDKIVSLPNRDEIAQRAKQYIEDNYRWADILDNVSAIIEEVAG